MPKTHTRRRFLGTLSLAAPQASSAPAGAAAEERLETTTVRSPRFGGSALPRNMSPRNCCRPKASPRSAM